MPSRNELLYIDKTDPWSSHSKIVEELAHFSPNTRVLDVGTASGTIGRMCAGRGFLINGIEPNWDYAEIARPYYHKLLCSTLENAPDDFLQGYDVVVCADVLEHLAEPCKNLLRLVGLQAERSAFIISVPNVANIYIRLSLLFGRFTYGERGILDRTHLRFYTRSTLLQMLDFVNLEVVLLHATPIPLNLVNPIFQQHSLGRLLHRFLAYLTNIAPGLLGYQFIIRAVTSGCGQNFQRDV